MPYRGGETEMVILLPANAADLDPLERTIDQAAWDGWLARLSAAGAEDVMVILPRFKIEARYNLTDTIRDLGMTTPLSNDSDFSAMKQVDPASRDEEDWNLKIDSIVHQVFVEVEEKGTEAAAATAMTMVMITGARIPKEPKLFRADHPFLFVIRDRRTNANLFVERFAGEAS